MLSVFMLCPCMCPPGLAWRSCDASCLHLSLLCFFPLQFLSFPPIHSCCYSPALSSFSLFPLYPLPSSQFSVGSCRMWLYSSVGCWGPSRLPSAPLMLIALRFSISVLFPPHYPLCPLWCSGLEGTTGSPFIRCTVGRSLHLDRSLS